MKSVGAEASGCEQFAHSSYAVAPDRDRTRDLLIASLTLYRYATTPRCKTES